MAGYPPDVIREFAARFPGSEDPIAKAEEAALAVAGFGEAIRRVDERIGWLSAHVIEPKGEREKLEAERHSLVVEALKEDAGAEGGALLQTDLIERAVQLHVGELWGRRKLSQEPGLTEWYADQILGWYRRGEPEGLWLDDDRRLCWGTAITPVFDREQGSAPTPLPPALAAYLTRLFSTKIRRARPGAELTPDFLPLLPMRSGCLLAGTPPDPERG